MADLKAFKAALFEAAKAAGFTACEMYASSDEDFSARAYQGELSEYKSARSGGVSFRGLYGGKMGCAYTEDMSGAAVPFLVKNAKENAEVIGEDEEELLFEGAAEYPTVNGYDEALAGIPPEAKIQAALNAEKAGLAADSRITAVDYNYVRTNDASVAIANSLGLDVSFKTNCAFCYCEAIAKQDGDTREGFKLMAAKGFAALDPEETARKAAAYAVSLLGAKPVKSGKYRVLLTREAAASLLQAFAPMFFADQAQKGLSLLSGKLGQAIASPAVSITDDPLLEGAINGAPFDGEGVPARKKALVEAGVFKTFLHSLKTAKRDGTASTGNGFRAGYKGAVTVKASNMFIVPSSASDDELRGQLGGGLIISGVSGVHAGANAASGDFSLLSEGYLVEGGKVTRPVDQITVAGNFLQLLADVEAVGDTLSGDLPDGSIGAVDSPALLVKELAVAGE